MPALQWLQRHARKTGRLLMRSNEQVARLDWVELRLPEGRMPPLRHPRPEVLAQAVGARIRRAARVVAIRVTVAMRTVASLVVRETLHRVAIPLREAQPPLAATLLAGRL
jgi:hypothetical protein